MLVAFFCVHVRVCMRALLLNIEDSICDANPFACIAYWPFRVDHRPDSKVNDKLTENGIKLTLPMEHAYKDLKQNPLCKRKVYIKKTVSMHPNE